MSETAILSKRLFIGGLSENVSEIELSERFSRFGKVSNVTLKTRKDENGAPLKSFAHLNLEGDEASIKKCFNTYQNAKWKGSVMKIQYAKENVLERLQKEREESASTTVEAPQQKTEKLPSPEIVTTAKGVPGTPVPGKKDWVVGKYGRAVPVLKLKKSYKIPMVKHDPSKYCHTAKVFKEEQQDPGGEGSFTKLTWEINEPDSAMTKKRKGEFPENSVPPKKKLPARGNDSIPKKEKRSSFPGIHHNSQNALSTALREENEIEFVKIGAVVGKSTGVKAKNISNKFDSDIESDSESHPTPQRKQPKPKPNSLKKSPDVSNKFDSDIESDSEAQSKPNSQKKSIDQITKTGVNGKSKSNTDSRVNGLSCNTNSYSLPVTQLEGNANQSFNRAGIPEFKGLSMLAALDKPFVKPDNVKSPTKLSPSPNPVNNKSKASNSSLTNTKLAQPNTPSMVSISNTNSFKEKSVVAKPSANTSIATPAPFNTQRAHESFKTSTPNAPSESLKQDSMPQDGDESQSFRLVPEFKGLGMLVDHSVKDKGKEPSLQPQKKKKENASKPDRNNSLSFDSPSPSNNSKRKEAENSAQKNVKAGNTPAPNVSSKTGDVNSAEKTKSLSKQRDQDMNFDSDSSASTDEIILRHKEMKVSDNSSHSKSKDLQKQPVLGNKFSKENISSDNNLLMSEFIFGVDEFGGDQSSNVTPAHRDNGSDSYDSDLDSNDFALVAKKLRQQAMRSKQGLTEKASSRERKSKDSSAQKDKVMSNTKEHLGKDRQEVSDLQSKLINIAGLKREPVKSSEQMDGESGLSKKQARLSEQDKHKTANEKRLEAVKLQAKQRQQQQQLMQLALKNVDSLEGNKKRIVFESSDDDDDDENEGGDEGKKNKSNSEKSLGSESVAAEKQDKSGPALFASSDEDESDEDDYDEMFKSKPQFEGKKGEKLLKMENRFGDKRFKMDAKFADTDSEEAEEDDDDNTDKKDENGSKNGIVADSDLSTKLKAEKSSSLKVLEDVVGKSTLDRFSEKINRNTKKIIDMNSVRFDPTKMVLPSPASVTSPEKKTVAKITTNSKVQPKEAPDSTKVKTKSLVTEEQKTDDSVKKNKVNSNEDLNNTQADQGEKKSKKSMSKKEEQASTKGKTNVELSSSLLNLFKTKAQEEEETAKDTGFSFAQQFGEDGNDEDEENGSNNIKEMEQDKKNFSKVAEPLALEKNEATVNNLDISAAETEEMEVDSDQEDNSTDLQDNEKIVDNTTNISSMVESELSSEEEEEEEEKENSEIPNLSTGENSKRGIDEDLQDAGRIDVRFTKEQWLEGWDALRQSIIKIYKKKHKDALKKKRILGETKRKKEFLKNSRKTGGGKKHIGGFKKR